MENLKFIGLSICIILTTFMWVEYDETIFIESIPKPRYFYPTQKQHRFPANENETKKTNK